MAAPIAHIFCALFLLYSGALDVDNITEFVLGTSFPDIRYLGVVDRNQTHEEIIAWDDIKNAPTSFEKGRLLHSLLDQEREKFVVEHDLYACFPFSRFRTQILKLYEDILLYDMVHNWQEIALCFDAILREECMYGIKEQDIILWHTLLKQYILKRPDPYQIFLVLQHRLAYAIQQEPRAIKKLFIKCTGELFNRIVYIKLTLMLRQIKKSKKIKAAMLFFYENIDRFLVK